MIGALIPISIWNQEFFLVSASIFVLFLSFFPAIINRNFKIKLPVEVDFVITTLLYLHYFLGEYSGFYVKVSWWDLFMHAGNSLVWGLAGFIVAFSLLLTSRIKAKPFFVSFFALSFSVFLGAIWEIFEFSMDYFFGFSMQKSGLVDTMTDLIVDVLGALVVSVLGFLYMKKEKPGIIHKILVRFVNNLE